MYFSIPMNWFKFLKYIIKEIDKVNRDFFWTNNTNNSKNENTNCILWHGIKSIDLNVKVD